MSRRTGVQRFPLDHGTLTLRRDPDAPDAWVLEVDGTRQSHVDLGDPRRLAFAYVRRIGHVVDVGFDAGAPLDAVHLGGGGLTLPRYIAATRPGSRQRVFEIDAALIDTVRAHLPLPARSGIRVAARDALDGLGALGPATADLVIVDVFREGRIPGHLAGLELVQAAARVLRPGGRYVANVVDRRPLAVAREQVANAQATWPNTAAVIEATVLNGRGSGNVVIVGSAAPLPLAALRARCTADRRPARVLDGPALERFRGGAAPAAPPAGGRAPRGAYWM